MAEKKQGFESSLGKLEELVSEMENGDLPLDDLMKRFETGKKLLAACRKELDAVMRRIEKVTDSGVETMEVEDDA